MGIPNGKESLVAGPDNYHADPGWGVDCVWPKQRLVAVRLRLVLKSVKRFF
jgi:hypothetical protein